MLIDCDSCTARGTACGDCVVTVLLGMPPVGTPTTGIELDPTEQAAISALAQHGLVPPLRLVTSPAGEVTTRCTQGCETIAL